VAVHHGVDARGVHHGHILEDGVGQLHACEEVPLVHAEALRAVGDHEDAVRAGVRGHLGDIATQQGVDEAGFAGLDLAGGHEEEGLPGGAHQRRGPVGQLLAPAAPGQGLHPGQQRGHGGSLGRQAVVQQGVGPGHLGRK